MEITKIRIIFVLQTKGRETEPNKNNRTMKSEKSIRQTARQGRNTKTHDQIVRAIRTGMDMRSRDTQVRHYRQVCVINVDGRRIALKLADGTIWLFACAKEQRRIVNRMQAVLDAFYVQKTACIRDGAIYLNELNKRVHIAIC